MIIILLTTFFTVFILEMIGSKGVMEGMETKKKKEKEKFLSFSVMRALSRAPPRHQSLNTLGWGVLFCGMQPVVFFLEATPRPEITWATELGIR